MTILSIVPEDSAGQVGVKPRKVSILCTNTYAQVSAAGFLNGANLQGITIQPTDILFVTYGYSASIGTGSFQMFVPIISGNVISLSIYNPRTISGTTPTYAGGGTSNTFTISNMLATAVGSCVIKTSTNSVSVTKAVPADGSLAVTFSADPGAGTVLTYIYSSLPQN